MYKLLDDILIYTENNKKFLINIQTGKVFALNEVAELVIEALQQNINIEEKVQQRFPNISIQQIRLDINNYIESLIENQCIIID